jgi:hypothetical protein
MNEMIQAQGLTKIYKGSLLAVDHIVTGSGNAGILGGKTSIGG